MPEKADTTLWPEALKYAPIVISVYGRPDVLRETIEALKRNTLALESVLFLFCDAPGHAEHAAAVQQARDYLHTVTGFKQVFVIEREKNYGPIYNSFDGVKQLLDRYDRIIFLEEDIVTAPYFLQFMNDALAAYRDDPRVMGISSYKPPFPDDPERKEVYFMHTFNPWGSAMWKKWREKTMRYDAVEVLSQLRRQKLLDKFDYYSTFIIPNSRMLKMTAARKINALDVVIGGNMLLQGAGSIFPPHSLSNHIGFGEGVHCTVKMTDFISKLYDGPIEVTGKKIPEDPRMVKSYHRWLLRVHLKLLFKYLITLGPIRKFFARKHKNREF